MLDVKVRAGNFFELDVPVSGEPPPTKEWSLKGDAILGDARIKVTHEDYNTKMRFLEARRTDTGVYTLIARNINGKDEASLKVNVIDVPSAPEGPLTDNNVTKSGCDLSWNEPRDDGGSEILYYMVEKQDSENMRWVPVAEAVTTKCRVDHLIEGHIYNFRIRAVNKIGESPPLLGMDSVTAKDPYDRPSKPGAPTPTDWDKDHVDLEWTPPKSDGGSPIEKYIIEKKPRFGQWEKALEVPGDSKYATVPGLQEGQEYEFRLVAVNKAGPSDPSDASVPVIAKPRFREYLFFYT